MLQSKLFKRGCIGTYDEGSFRGILGVQTIAHIYPKDDNGGDECLVLHLMKPCSFRAGGDVQSLGFRGRQKSGQN